MGYKVTDLQKLGEALGLELVDEMPEVQSRLDKLRSEPGDAGPILPLIEGLVRKAGTDRTSLKGWHLCGERDGIRVMVNPIENQRLFETHVDALFEAPLGLGLEVTFEPIVARVFQKLTGRRDLQTGNAELDRTIHVVAEDTAGAAALLSDPETQRVLQVAYGAQPFPVITDERARVVVPGFESDIEKMSRRLETVTSIVRAMGKHRA